MNRIVFVFVLLFCFSVLLLLNSKEKFNNMTKATAQHNPHIVITEDSYKYIINYKKQLLENITNLLNDFDIKFVICWGNLIEYERNKPIYHDDDVDITFNVDDLPKWENFCRNNNEKVKKYNLVFDDRIKNIEKQKFNGIQFRLLQFKNSNKIKEFDMDIHGDLVMNRVVTDDWPNVDIDYNNLRKIKLYDVLTFAPCVSDTNKILSDFYGKDFLKPDNVYKWKKNNNKWTLYKNT